MRLQDNLSDFDHLGRDHGAEGLDRQGAWDHFKSVLQVDRGHDRAYLRRNKRQRWGKCLREFYFMTTLAEQYRARGIGDDDEHGPG